MFLISCSFQPIWILLEFLAERARYIASEFNEYLISVESRQEEIDDPLIMALSNEKFAEQQQEWHNSSYGQPRTKVIEAHGLRKLLEREIKILLRVSVESILQILYRQLRDEARKQGLRPLHTAHEPRAKWIHIFAELYPNGSDEVYPHGSLVGPVGERPLHVCGLLAARYRGEGEDQGELIAEGIFEGMQSFLGDGKWMHEARFPYGRDYCAAVGHYIETRGLSDAKKELEMLPHFKYVSEWYSHRSRKKRGKIWQKHKHHITAIVQIGLYEGETLLFPFIASGYEDAVKWLLEQYSKLESDNEAKTSDHRNLRYMYLSNFEEFNHILTEILFLMVRITCMKAKGLFFRPVFQDWLTSFYVSDGWMWYRHCRGRGKNRYASSPKTYFGFDLLAFAARYVFIVFIRSSMMIICHFPKLGDG